MAQTHRDIQELLKGRMRQFYGRWVSIRKLGKILHYDSCEAILSALSNKSLPFSVNPTTGLRNQLISTDEVATYLFQRYMASAQSSGIEPKED